MKNKNSVIMMLVILFASTLALTSCNDVRNIPAGYVAKKLTPIGWDTEIKEAGQIDIGKKDNDGTATSLVLLESTSITVKEQFLKKGADEEDHRATTADGTPLSADVYIQISIPTDKKTRDAIFAMMTPTPDPKDDRISWITITSIYDRFAKMVIRGKARSIIAQYKDAEAVMKNYEKVNGEIALMAIEVVKESKAPFQIVSAQISNVKEDPLILESKNKLTAATNEAQAIEKIGKAVRENPEFLESKRLDVLKEIGSKNTSSLVVMDTKNSTPVVLPISK